MNINLKGCFSQLKFILQVLLLRKTELFHHNKQQNSTLILSWVGKNSHKYINARSTC